MVELMVTMTLLTLIVFALMAVFSSTQTAFRASVTQTDVLEGSRAAVDLITTDLRGMTPSYGHYDWTNGPVNFYTWDNSFVPTLTYQPLRQSLPGTGAQRLNVLNYFFFIGRNNQKWTATGYAVNSASNAGTLYPLYRFYAETNIAVSPYFLFVNFTNAIYYQQWTNLSHVLDGVVSLTVRPYDANGYWMTTNQLIISSAAAPIGQTNYCDNTYFSSNSVTGEMGVYFFSNAVPAAVELQMGVLEDRTLARAKSLPGLPSPAQSNYLSQQAGHVHLFRERVTIPNVDLSAYQ